jgi:hypothetical protein
MTISPVHLLEYAIVGYTLAKAAQYCSEVDQGRKIESLDKVVSVNRDNKNSVRDQQEVTR